MAVLLVVLTSMTRVNSHLMHERFDDAVTGISSKALAYRPDIDGLRALAVVPVILFHFNKQLFPAGYLGVDVFFVISGFLITSLLLREWQQRGTVSLLGFWRRRVLRIVPALATMVLVTFCIGQVVLYAPERFDLAVNSSAALLSVANFTHWLNYGSYWGAAADSSPLLHTWSLSVEEQFYFLYPLALLLLLKFARGWLIPALGMGLIVSFSLYSWGVGATPAATFYLLPTRAWELAAGAVAAALCFRRGLPALAKPIWAVVGMLLVASAYLLIRSEGLSYFLWAPVLGSALMLACNQGSGCVTTRFLSLPPLVAIGKVSYSLYLWHWPVLLLSRSVGERYGVTIWPIAVLAIIVVASVASYRFVEKPIRHRPELVPHLVIGFLVLAAAAFSVRNPEADALLVPADMIAREKSVKVMSKMTEKCKACTPVATDDVFLQRDDAVVARKNEVLYIDDDHLSTAGAMLLRKRFQDVLSPLLNEERK